MNQKSYEYTEHDLIEALNWSESGSYRTTFFDQLLLEKWHNAVKAGRLIIA